MRVIAGTARGMPLRRPSSPGTRPISDRGKEALFNILAPRIPGARFLDLFAGTGGVGIEALSRGAEAATFVERDETALGDLRFNLGRTRLEEGAAVVRADVFGFLRRTPEAFDVVFVAPPQWMGLWEQALVALDAAPGWVAGDGVIVVQTDPKEVRELELAAFERADLRRYGGVAFSFFIHR